jgi:Domain of unknown function (DUF4352)
LRPITAVTIAALAVALAACESNTGTSQSSSSTSSTSVTTDIGKTRTLTYPGYGNGVGQEDVAVTVIKVVPSPSSSEQGFGPAPGDQWVAVQISVKNLDSAPYTDSPNDSMTAIDAAGQSVAPADDAPTTVGPQFPDQLALTTGSTATGVVTFQVPSGDQITAVQFAPGEGQGTDAGKWTVG